MFYEELERLKEKEDIAILAHYYVDEEIQELADYVGDSFFLAQKGREIENKTIIMAGVYFMGETIKILNPTKRVFNLNYRADCPMAHMIDENKIKKIKEQYEDIAVVCYVNSTMKVKALSDICVTSSNALEICKNLKQKNIFFIPDQNLANYIARELPEKNFIEHDGFCPRHHVITKEQILELKSAHPNAKVLIHPECRMEVLELADYIGSTKGIIERASKDEEEFIIVTVRGIEYELRRRNPKKKFYFVNGLTCINMNIHRKEDLLNCINIPINEVKVDEEIAKKALIPLERMLRGRI